MAEQNHPSPGEKNDADKNNPTPVDLANKAAAFTNDISGGISIGPGTSDQGFEPGEEDRDDEFRRDGFRGEVILDEENVQHAERPTHGLVEEGPGPDS